MHDRGHTHHDAVMYWVWSAPVFICGALLLTQAVVRAVLHRRGAE